MKDKKNIKVLEVIDSLGWCGTKEQTYLITKYLSDYFDVELALAFNHNEMIEKLKDKVNLKFYEYDNGSKRRFNIKNYLRLYRILKSGNYDVVVANSSWAFNYILAVYPFLKRKPKLVAMRRSGFLPSFFSKHFKYRFADKIVVVSKDVADLLKEKNFYPEKIVVIESGIDLSRFKPNLNYRKEIREKFNFREDEKIFINVANFQPWRKGQDILLEAFSKLNCERCKLLLVGHNTNSEEARALIKKFSLENKVIPLGFRYDVDKLLNGADYFILTSNSEGIAGAVLQAMSTGKVVISTLAGGIGEYLVDGYNGFSCEVGDVNCLARKMGKALSLSTQEYKELSQRAIETANKYSIEKTVNRWRNLIEQIVDLPKSENK